MLTITSPVFLIILIVASRLSLRPADLAMEWELRFMLDQQIMELVEDIQKRAVDSVSYRLKASSTMD